jgi:potassium efflux system protein
VAYGCDTEKAKNLLLEIANNHPEVMDDPAPFAAFDQFGDSSLNIVLRCYLPNLDKRLATIHEIHTQIHERFNMEGIEIPFPQRDLHIRSVISGMNGLNVEPPKA